MTARNVLYMNLKLTAPQAALLARIKEEGEVDLRGKDNQTADALARRGLVTVTRESVYWIARPA